ncbi:MAG: glycoside hydrolase family 28 protein [Prevotella sp.]|nr:glycoside hydrolase family 28 protein [Prevotella sp.]
MDRTYLSILFFWLSWLAVPAQVKVYDVTAYGAVGDGKTDDAAAIQRTIDVCNSNGGGQVYFPNGRTFLTGPLQLKSKIQLYLDFGATLLANPDESVYKLSAFGENRGEGMMWLWGKDINHLSIVGNGTINGNGVSFMGEELLDSYALKPVTSFDPRPHVLTIIGGQNIRISDLTIKEGAYWTVHLVGCDDVAIEGISLLNNLKIRNGDGIDIDHSRNVRISNCYITSGDDCICLKNRREFASHGPCHDIVVTNCTMTSRSCAIKIGSENMDSIYNVTVNNCIITKSNRGLGIQNRDEGTVTDVSFSNIIMDLHLWSDVWWGKAEPIYVTSFPRADSNNKDGNWRFPKGKTRGECGEVSRIYFNNIFATSENGCYVGGDTYGKVNNIYFNNVKLRRMRSTSYDSNVFDLRPRQGEGFVKNNKLSIIGERISNCKLDIETTR